MWVNIDHYVVYCMRAFVLDNKDINKNNFTCNVHIHVLAERFDPGIVWSSFGVSQWNVLTE